MSGRRLGQITLRLLLSGILTSIFCGAVSAQLGSDMATSLANHMEYSFSTETNNEILENWLDADFYFDAFTAGLRMELYQPSEVHTLEEDITFRYFEYHRDDIDVRVGNYYAMFGRGLVLRTYEDRNIRIDNNLEGIKIGLSHNRLSATFLSGRPEGSSGERTDLLHGADLTLNPIERVAVGGSYLSNSPDRRKKAEITSGRMELSLSSHNWVWDMYGEYGERTNPQGTGAYLSSSLTTAGFGLSFEYKYYDTFFFRTDDYNVTYNNPPSLVREHAYTLLNRHPHVLDADDEAGIQIEATFSPSMNTALLANYSLTKDHEGKTIWGEGKTLFEEGYGEFEHHFNDAFFSIGALSVSEQGPDTYVTPIFESTYSLDEVNSLRFVFQHQHTKSQTLGEFDNQIYSLEYARSPRFTLSLVGEWTNKSDVQKMPGEKSFWLFGKLDVNISPNHDLSVMYGSRQAGFICAGGVCRYEPEFEGIEVKLFSRL
ncbi:MAG: DUF6029 family protein [bacterium]